MPVGTGPFKIVMFQFDEATATSVVDYVRNENFRVPGQPFFSQVTIQGGGSAEDAAQAVLTGEADYAGECRCCPKPCRNFKSLSMFR